MAEVLTQTEIDALLAAVSTGNVEMEDKSAKSTPDWIAYDLTSQEKIVRGRLVALQGIHERFGRIFRVTLSNMLKKNVTVNVNGTDFMRFSDALSNVMLPASLNILSVPELRGTMVMVINSKLAYALVDAYYGGAERPFSRVGGREEFTTIENTMIQKICACAVRDLREAWKLNYPLDIQYVRAEANPQFVGAIHSAELVAVVNFGVEFESLSGTFSLAIQLKALDPIQHALNINVTSEISTDAEAWQAHWLKEVSRIELGLCVELGTSRQNLRQLRNLKIGDTLMLEQDAARPLRVLVEDIPKFSGLMGLAHGSTAVRLTEVLPLEMNTPKPTPNRR